MFFFTNYQHRARGGPGNAFGCAANGEPLPPAEAVRSDHDEVDIKLFGCFNDLVRCNSSAKYGLCANLVSHFG